MKKFHILNKSAIQHFSSPSGLSHIQKILIRISSLCVFSIILYCSNAAAQDSLAIYRFDDRYLAKGSGTTLISDPTANRGTALFRPSTAESGTFWFGPYKKIQGGNYLLQCRLKVCSNLSDALLFRLDMISPAGGIISLDIKPTMFRKSGEWQLFTIPVQVNENNSDWEIRGISFQGNVTDVYMDYITLTPGDPRGFYSDEFTVTSNGSVGIGTAFPKDYKLAVNGKIRAQEIKVETNNWPDYVFKSDYPLRSLQETKAYIDQFKHLPDLPSAATMVSNGISLGEMNKLLVKKVEELTLYLIEKDKKEKEQEQRLNQFQRELLELKKSIHSSAGPL